jgi:hypothetical protein
VTVRPGTVMMAGVRPAVSVCVCVICLRHRNSPGLLE